MGFFATKQQLKERQCLLYANIEILEGRLEVKDLSEEIAQISGEISMIEERSWTVREHTKEQRLQFLAKAVEISFKKQMDAQNRLRSGDCEGK